MERVHIFLLGILAILCSISGSNQFSISQVSDESNDDNHMHRVPKFSSREGRQDPPYEDAEFWKTDAQSRLQAKLEKNPIEARAKNVIFYLGDGMSVQTVTAARIMKGQKVDNLPFGEEAELHMDSFPYTGTSKTFCSDSQVADSACSATAYLCGSKGNIGTIGVTPDVPVNSCERQADPNNHVSSVLAWAQAAGKSTGVVTTTRITHASPSGAYAHIANRDWENDAAIASSGGDPELCDDIAEQLILREPGRNINVILGGGRLNFLPGVHSDPEYPLLRGNRRDGKNLLDEWVTLHNSSTSHFITGRSQLLEINPNSTDFLLGLFEADHLRYYHEQAEHDDPSLSEIVEVAVKILSRNPEGFFLFVEGGRIDHAHHANLIQRSLWETIEFDRAIQKGDELTADEDTLLLVTADHSHVMQFGGYPERGNPILQFPEGEDNLANDSMPYHTLLYANGPGLGFFSNLTAGTRRNITEDDFEALTYVVPSAVPLVSETHGGDDVLIFAKGPYAHFLTGVHQQSYIPHLVGYASCIGEGAVSEHCV